MAKSYWAIFYLSLAGCILLLGLLLLILIFMRRSFLAQKYGLIKLVAVSVILLVFFVFSGANFIRCCNDYHYVANGLFEEEKAKVLGFTYSKKDYAGNGQTINAKPKFYLIDQNEIIVLYAKDVEVGKTYLIRYYPNTKICEVLQEVQ